MRLFGLDITRKSQKRSNTVTISTSPSSLYNSGVTEVTSKELALRIATVYRCADILSKGIAQLPLKLMHNSGGYFVEDEKDHLNYLLSVQPNSRMTGFELIRNAVLQLLFNGNAYIFPEVGENGWQSLKLLRPGTVLFDDINNLYTVADPWNNVGGTFGPMDIIHLKNLSTDGGIGISTLTYASRVMAISANADTDNIDTFKTQGLFRGFVSGKDVTVGFGELADSQLQDVASTIENQINSGNKIFTLPGEMNFNEMSMKPSDLQLLETKQFNVLEICRFFGVHPDKVFAQQTTNYKASEMSQVSFLTDTLQPYLRQFELEFQIKLIPEKAYYSKRVDFDIEPLLQTDLNTQADYMTKTIATGVRTVNYWRMKLGQPPVEGGDKPLVSANLLPLNGEKMSQQQEPQKN